LKVKTVHSSLEKNSCLNACVLLKHESIVATPNPSRFSCLLRDEQKVSLGEFVDSN
jgi:hypothetical protein